MHIRLNQGTKSAPMSVLLPVETAVFEQLPDRPFSIHDIEIPDPFTVDGVTWRKRPISSETARAMSAYAAEREPSSRAAHEDAAKHTRVHVNGLVVDVVETVDEILYRFDHNVVHPPVRP